MDMDSIFNDWRQNAERHDSRNFKFLRSLKMKSERAVDRAARRLHEEAFSIIDCLQCGNCCKTVNPTLTPEDIARIAAHLGMDAAAFRSEYLTESEDRGLMEPKSLPCPFLADDNRCRIYEVRPTSCAEYPHTNKPEFATRSYMHSGNTLQCPAVFYIVEGEPKAYGVLALADPMEAVIGPYLPVLTKTVLRPFKDKIVYDGLVACSPLVFGGGIERMLNDTYKRAKADFGIITSLPFSGQEPEPEKEPEAVIVTYGRSGEAHETRIGGKREAATFPLRLTPRGLLSL